MYAKLRGLVSLGSVLSSLLLGGCGSIHSTVSTEIERSADATWAMFADANRRTEWLHDWHGLPWADADPAVVGRAVTVELREDEDVMELTQTISSIEPPREFAFQLVHEWADVDNVICFEPRGPDACTVSWSASIHPSGPWQGLWMHCARRSITARYSEHLAKLKTMVEAEPAH